MIDHGPDDEEDSPNPSTPTLESSPEINQGFYLEATTNARDAFAHEFDCLKIFFLAESVHAARNAYIKKEKFLGLLKVRDLVQDFPVSTDNKVYWHIRQICNVHRHVRNCIHWTACERVIENYQLKIDSKCYRNMNRTN